jgi:2-polyprenyl-6-methoxyphenol hydroxylase-like FAD-dependent oxidoreductase
MPEPPTDCDVLIVGAGPSGLVLGLFLTLRGIRVQIVDKTAAPGTTSRALAVQARTLEFYAQVGLAGTVVERGRRVLAFNLWVGGRRKARAVLGEIGKGLSPFPYALVFPQDEHEQLLVDRLRSLGVEVQRRTALTRFDEAEGGVRATLETADGRQSVRSARFIAGCDGAHSQVREGLGIGFPGGTYEHTFYVADIEGSGSSVNGEIHVDFDVVDFLAVFPLKQDGHARLVGTVRPDVNPGRELEWEDVSRTAIDHVGLRVSRVNWFSTYRVHHRVANAFRRGRAFLVGDAAHIHSPVGGQGMNTGIGDAVNLAWKLAAVIRGKAGATLLDTYEPERIAYARRLVATTDRGFTGVTGTSAFARLFRMDVVPAVLPTLFRLAPLRRFFFRTVSQTGIDYRQSALSAGQAGLVHGGDRLPWVPPAGGGPGNFEPLTSLDWQVHVYGDQPAGSEKVCAARGLPMHVFPWSDTAAHAGLERGALYLVRPDGYVGLAAANAQSLPKTLPESLNAYLDRYQITLIPS